MMDNSIWSILDVIFVGAGLYVLYALVLMKTKGEIKTGVLMGKDVQLKKCRDLEGFKNYVAPRMLVFGIACALYGGAGLVNTYVTALPVALYGVVAVLFLLVLIWYGYSTRKAVQRFW